VLRAWLAERKGRPGDPLFPTSTGRPLSRDAIEQRISVHAAKAAQACPSLRSKHVTAHTLRHTCAMNLLQAGNGVAVIALWLGHEQVSTTSISLHADMTRKNARSPAPSRSAPPPAATAPPPASWPSSKPLVMPALRGRAPL
jgi:integrase